MNYVYKSSFIYTVIFTFLTVIYPADSSIGINTQITDNDSPSYSCVMFPILCKDKSKSSSAYDKHK
ncbi:hypothetical protein PSDI105340_15480 [Pseudoalteromonas distincta]